MNHALAIYTALFLSIIYLTVSIWSGDIRKASGESLAMLVLIGSLSIKVAIDDYVNFQATFSDKRRLHVSLWFSLGMYLLLAASTANAATAHIVVAELLLSAAMILGILWMMLTKSENLDIAEQVRIDGWLGINLLFIFTLGIDMLWMSESDKDGSVHLMYFLSLVVVFDAVRYGTLKRLANL